MPNKAKKEELNFDTTEEKAIESGEPIQLMYHLF